MCVHYCRLFGIYFVHQSPERKSYLCKYWRLDPHPPNESQICIHQAAVVVQSVLHLCYVAWINLCTLRKSHPFALSYTDCGKPSQVMAWFVLWNMFDSTVFKVTAPAAYYLSYTNYYKTWEHEFPEVPSLSQIEAGYTGMTCVSLQGSTTLTPVMYSTLFVGLCSPLQLFSGALCQLVNLHIHKNLGKKS